MLFALKAVTFILNNIVIVTNVTSASSNASIFSICRERDEMRRTRAEIAQTFETVGVDDYVGEKICHDQMIVVRVKVIIYDITVPVKQASVFPAEFAYLKTLLQKVAGTAVMEILFRMKGMP